MVKTSKKVKSGESALLQGSLYSSPPHPVGPPHGETAPANSRGLAAVGGRSQQHCFVLGPIVLYCIGRFVFFHWAYLFRVSRVRPWATADPGGGLRNTLDVTLYRPHSFKGSALCSCCPVGPSRSILVLERRGLGALVCHFVVTRPEDIAARRDAL